MNEQTRNVVDSSGWIEYFTDGAGANAFSKPINNVAQLVVPTVSISEVFRFVLHEAGEREALQVAALMRQGVVVPLSETLAMQAASFGQAHRLPLADSIICVTAHLYSAVIWTQDVDFKSLSCVEYIPKGRT